MKDYIHYQTIKLKKPPKWVKVFYDKIEEVKKKNTQGLFLPDNERYRPLKAASCGSNAGFEFVQEELRKLFDLPDYVN